MSSFIKAFDVVLSGPNNPQAQPNLLGIVLRIYDSTFVRKTMAVIVFENGQFGDYQEADIEGGEITPTEFNTPLLKGFDFSLDPNITELIKSTAFKDVFDQIRIGIEKMAG